MGNRNYTIKQKPLSLKVRYEILDERKNKVFEVVGPVFGQVFSPYVIIDSMERQLIWIRKTPFKFMPRYDISDEKGILAVLKRKFGFFKRNLILETPGQHPYTIFNNYRMDDCQVVRDGYTVANIRRRGFSAWRTYDINIDESEDDELILGIAVAIDQIYIGYQRS